MKTNTDDLRAKMKDIKDDRLVIFVSLGCDILDEFRLIREALDRETLPPPCPQCQGMRFHLPICALFDSRIEGARDMSFVEPSGAVKFEDMVRMSSVPPFGPRRCAHCYANLDAGHGHAISCMKPIDARNGDGGA